MTSRKIILASASPARLALLKQLGITPDQIIATNIDETVIKRELAQRYVTRLARQKAEAALASVTDDHDEITIIAADTAVEAGRNILHKTANIDQARAYLQRLSGGRHRVFTAVSIYYNGVFRTRLTKTTIKFKRLTTDEIEHYLTLDQWQNCAGGYRIQGYAEAFISFIQGSYSGVVGLPLHEVRGLLQL